MQLTYFNKLFINITSRNLERWYDKESDFIITRTLTKKVSK